MADDSSVGTTHGMSLSSKGPLRVGEGDDPCESARLSLSSDKAAHPSTLYGSCKLVAEKIFQPSQRPKHYRTEAANQAGCEADDSEAEIAAATSGKSLALRIFSSSARTV